MLKLNNFYEQASKINNKQVMLIKLLFHPLPLVFLKSFDVMSNKTTNDLVIKYGLSIFSESVCGLFYSYFKSKCNNIN